IYICLERGRMPVDGSTGGRVRGSGRPRTWRDDFGIEVDVGPDAEPYPGYRLSGPKPPVRTIPRRRRSPTPSVLVPGWLSGQLARQLLYAGVVLVLAAAAFRLPYDLGARLQAAAAEVLTRDVDLEQAAEAVRETLQRGRAWMAQNVAGEETALPAASQGSGAGPVEWAWPAAGTAILGYGWVDDGAGGTLFHEGLDIAADLGTPVAAAAPGTVTRVWSDDETGGLAVEIDHGGGWTSRYSPLREAYVAAGEPVLQGDVIAAVGEPAHGDRPHLHFEIRRDGTAVDPEPKLRRDEGSS
ncbi:MAG TPA: M23 family metallopeptidase, partial [Bacillota bacterium]